MVCYAKEKKRGEKKKKFDDMRSDTVILSFPS